MSDNVSIAEQVPAELWLTIFELTDHSSDLNNVVRTCRCFYQCGIRALHRRLIWKRPGDFVHNSALWETDDALAAGVHSLELHISALLDDVSGVMVQHNGRVVTRQVNLEQPPPVENLNMAPFWHVMQADEHTLARSMQHSMSYYHMNQTYASPVVYNLLISRLATFSRLQTLTLKHLFVSDQLLGALFELPALRKLHVEFCIFPRRPFAAPRDFSALPIEDLTLLNLRRPVVRAGVGHDAHAFADLDDDMELGLSLASARTLQTLRVDSTADVFALVYRRRVQGIYQYNIPPHLSSLYVQRKQIFDGAVQPTFHAEQLFPSAVYSIMERCPTITTVSLGYALPKHSSFPKHDSLPNLTFCEGYLDAVSAMTTNRPLKGISILRSDAATETILDLLAKKAKENPKLELLSLHCKTWDLEILDAICQLFPELRKLKLTFDLREPGKLWEHRDYWNGIPPYEMYDALEEARMQREFMTGSRGPEEVSVAIVSNITSR